MKTQPAGLILILLVAAGAGTASAAGVRGDIRSVVSWVDYRPLFRDSVPESLVAGDGTTRRLPDGTIVVCIPGQDCYYYRPGRVETATPVVHSLRLTAWSGLRGVSVRTHVRSRTGSDAFWPRSDQDLLLMNASIDFERPDYRLRAGRQDRGGGLGIHYFDGGSALWRGFRSLRIEAFAGRSLARTLLEPRTGSLLAESDDLAPDEPSVLWGLEGRWRPSKRLRTALLYQREIRADRAGLYSERLAADVLWSAATFSADASADFDVATGVFNDARLTLRRPLTRRINITARGRHYRPFFELWTIWGVFSPVGFNEASLRGSWAATPTLQVEAGAAHRSYEDTSTESEFIPIEGDGWRAEALAHWARTPWSAGAQVRLHRGFGAYRSSLDVSLRREFGRRHRVGIFGMSTQQFAEFRFGEGVTRGAGVDLRTGAGRLSLDGSAALYRHTFENRPGFSDYNQFRGRLGVTVTLGTEPTLPRSVYGKAAGS